MNSVQLGSKFIRRGLWLFVFGLVIGYGPWAHYMHGAMEDVQPAFLKNVTLRWGCPWTLAAHVAQLGSLAMVIFGLCYLVGGRSTTTVVSAAERLALQLCFLSTSSSITSGRTFTSHRSTKGNTCGSARRGHVSLSVSSEPCLQ